MFNKDLTIALQVPSHGVRQWVPVFAVAGLLFAGVRKFRSLKSSQMAQIPSSGQGQSMSASDTSDPNQLDPAGSTSLVRYYSIAENKKALYSSNRLHLRVLIRVVIPSTVFFSASSSDTERHDDLILSQYVWLGQASRSGSTDLEWRVLYFEEQDRDPYKSVYITSVTTDGPESIPLALNFTWHRKAGFEPMVLQSKNIEADRISMLVRNPFNPASCHLLNQNILVYDSRKFSNAAHPCGVVVSNDTERDTLTFTLKDLHNNNSV